jgi:hypothetical protein
MFTQSPTHAPSFRLCIIESRLAVRYRHPGFFGIAGSLARRPSHVVAWLRMVHPELLKIAGNRESVSPEIGDRVERFLREVFRQLGTGPTSALRSTFDRP